MDRVNGADWVNIGGGRRGFRSENAAAGISGTEVTAAWLNAVQENLLKVIEEAGLIPDITDWDLLWKALQVGPSGRRDMPVNGWQSAPPAEPVARSVYVVKAPAAAGTAFEGHDNAVGTFVGGGWVFVAPVAGLQVQYWDGRQIVLRFDGATWAEDLASEAAAGRVELATPAEVKAFADAARAVTPSGVGPALQSLTPSYAAAAGTANVLAATLTPVPASLPALIGAPLRLLIAASNTGPVTLNVNGLGARDVRRRDGRALDAGSLVAGEVATLIYDGAVWQAVNVAGGSGPYAVGNIITIKASETYVPPAGVRAVLIEGNGGGGAGGGAPELTGSESLSLGGGGGAGGYFRKLISAPAASYAVTIGLGGVPAVGAAGGNGGSTSFGSAASASGGQGGGSGTINAGTSSVYGGVGGAGVGGDVNAHGEAGGRGASSTGGGYGGNGASSFLGGGGLASASVLYDGYDATSPGSGGGGGVLNSSGFPSTSGGAGADGIIIVTELY